MTLPALHIVHDAAALRAAEAIGEIAELLELTPAEVHDTMTFYGFFRAGRAARRDAGLGLPVDLACMLARRRGAAGPRLRHGWASSPGETTADGKLTLEFAECLGVCEGAPAVLVDDGRVFGTSTPRRWTR